MLSVLKDELKLSVRLCNLWFHQKCWLQPENQIATNHLMRRIIHFKETHVYSILDYSMNDNGHGHWALRTGHTFNETNDGSINDIEQMIDYKMAYNIIILCLC